MANEIDPLPELHKHAAVKPAQKTTHWLTMFLGLSGLGFGVMLCFCLLFYVLLWQTKDDLMAALTAISTSAGLGDQSVHPNQIAFIGNDNNVWLVSPDGENLQALTSDAGGDFGYRFPTWSPDGRHLAFIGPYQNQVIALYVSAFEEMTPTALYSASSSAPFYLYWAPDGKAITFLTQERSGLAMRTAKVPQEGDSQLLEKGAPFYWVWSPLGDKLFMHVGGSRTFSTEAHLSILENRQGAERVELKLAPGRFQAPLWSADGKHIFYVAQAATDDEAIFRMDTETLEQYRLTDLEGIGQTYLVMSPDNQYLAYLEVDLNRPIPLASPYLVNTTSGETRLITNRSVLSMYWSPDGTKLALLTAGFEDAEPSVKGEGRAAPLPQQVVFRWWVYEVATDTLAALLSIDPTTDFLQTVPYFDQYHLSLTFWSPDSRYFVATTELEEGEGGAVMVVDTSGQEPPRQVGLGKLAIWSWK